MPGLTFRSQPAPGRIGVRPNDRDLGGGDDLVLVTGIRDGNRLPGVPKMTLAATATYGSRFNDNADWYVNASVQHIGSRYTCRCGPGVESAHIRARIAVQRHGRQRSNGLDLKLPSYVSWSICRRASNSTMGWTSYLC